MKAGTEIQSRTGVALPRRLSPDDRKLIVAGIGILIAVFALVFSNVAANHAPKPHDLPIGVVGPPAVAETVNAQLAHLTPGGFRIYDYDSLAAARRALRNRSIYGAFQPTPSVLLVATAASPPVAALLQRVFTGAARTTGQSLVVQDVVPLPASDSAGATTISSLLGLILVGLAGTSVVCTFTRRRSMAATVIATAVLGVGAGLVTAIVTNLVVGAFPGQFCPVWGVATLFVLAIGMPIAALQTIFGIAGTAIGFILFLVIGSPASGGSSAPELLPDFWRDLGQNLPDGAAVTSLRRVVYFNGHGSTHALIVLTLYAILGAAVALIAAKSGIRLQPKRAT